MLGLFCELEDVVGECVGFVELELVPGSEGLEGGGGEDGVELVLVFDLEVVDF